jgi:hypothetical protein
MAKAEERGKTIFYLDNYLANEQTGKIQMVSLF